MLKKSKCCICHKFYDYKLTRLVRMKYGIGTYNQYYQETKYDICNNCIRVFDKWLNNYKEH